ncbi:PX domain-containing protein [Paracoccidioides lutzii Pb01]|uniref:PX domain-containing protein n=1 Tax=Paracoccidioides lutzii (strain ATCC MYA-826 / Pb01) TaxID=502779 RepID=C1H9R0_PARBA|nr:PX domain-containing protein [Paracoccidioides lutzii Pb01]EEH37083.1 PX domain-containing protein [Paracoccidioides lutzii Pb01]
MDESEPKVTTTEGLIPTSDGSESWPPRREDFAESAAGAARSSQSQSQSAFIQSSLLNQCLRFLASANHVTLAALGGALLAIIYLLPGRLALVLFGVSVGVTLHASWDGYKETGDEAVKSSLSLRRRELGIEVISRVLRWRETRITDTLSESSSPIDKSINNKEPDFAGFQPATAAALNSLTDAIIRDYVQWWYGPLLISERAFPLSCRSSLTRFIISISSHLSRKRPADIFLHFVTNAASIAVVFLNEFSAAFESASSNSTWEDVISSYLKEYPDSNLANVLSTDQQRAKLRLVATDIIKSFLEPDLYNCEPVQIFFREVFSDIILESVIVNCSKPEWINGWIVRLLEEGEPELMNAIDIGVDRARQEEMQAFAARSLSDVNNSSMSEDSTEQDIVVENLKRGNENKGLTKAQLEMEEAEKEAKRLSALIAVSNAYKSGGQPAMNETGSDPDPDPDTHTISSKIFDPQVPPIPTDDRRSSNDSARSEMSRDSKELRDVRNSVHESPSKQEDLIQTILLGASVSIVDDTLPNDKGKMRVKPTDDYLLQIEPFGSRIPGWVIARKYSDFEALHEVLRRISVVSGVSDFVEQHKELPPWKGQYKLDLRQSLERYLQHALSFERLASCEAMKRFLEKERGGLGASSLNGAGKVGFSFPSQAVFENMGKGVLGVLSNAPKGMAGGGKAVLEGVTGVFGANIAHRKRSIELEATKLGQVQSVSRSSTQHDIALDVGSSENGSAEKSPVYVTHSQDGNATLKRDHVAQLSPSPSSEHIDENQEISPVGGEKRDQAPTTISSNPADQIDSVAALAPAKSEPNTEPRKSTPKPSSGEPRTTSLSEEEITVAVELLFAVINELYALSSVWAIRKKLLNAAKSFLLRPGNPHIEAIRLLVQKSIIESNASDDAVAARITVLRQNALPTEDELKEWPPALTEDEKNELRVKARRLLVTRGMPDALTSIMGQSATVEALGHVFDSLQVSRVARGFIFALMLQALKAVIQ